MGVSVSSNGCPSVYRVYREGPKDVASGEVKRLVWGGNSCPLSRGDVEVKETSGERSTEPVPLCL